MEFEEENSSSSEEEKTLDKGSEEDKDHKEQIFIDIESPKLPKSERI